MKKEEKILPVEIDNIYDCFDSLIYSVFNYLGWSYELLFFDAWHFEFDNTVYDEQVALHQRLKIVRNHRWDYLETYHGIILEDVECNDIVSIKNRIDMNIEDKIPVLAYVDVYWCAWHPEGYLKLHEGHEIVIVGSVEDGYIVKDIQHAKDGVRMTYEEINRCVLEVSFIVKNKSKKKFEWEREIVTMANTVIKEGISQNIKNFAFMLEDREFLEKEISSFSEMIYLVPLFQKISQVSMSRRQVANALRYIKKEFSVDHLDNFILEMDQLGTRWSSTFGMICKAFCIPNERRNMVIDRAIMKIREIADIEQNIAQRIVEYEYKNEEKRNLEEKNEIRKCYGKKEFVQLDLHTMYNCNGISNNLTYDNRAIFTSDDRYIYVSELDYAKLSCVQDIPFSVANISEGFNNHISCYGEVIYFEPKNYEAIYILCNADLENQIDRFVLLYEDNIEFEYELKVTSWLKTPTPDESIALICKGVARNDVDQSVYTYPFDTYIFIKEIPINYHKKCVGIKLPICPNIHIYAATLQVARELY